MLGVRGQQLGVGEEPKGSNLGTRETAENLQDMDELVHGGDSSGSTETAHTGCNRDGGGGETEEDLTEGVL